MGWGRVAPLYHASRDVTRAAAVGREAGGRHTPFHNRYRLMISDFGMSRSRVKADTYVRKIAAKKDTCG